MGQGYAAGDYRISPYSPCVDAGDPDPAYDDNCIPPAHGELRNDMGAFGGPMTCPGFSGVGPQSAALQERHVLYPNSPNPFNASTVICYELAEPEEVSLRVYDVVGRLVRALVEGEVVTMGRHESTWDGTDESGRTAASGVYFYRLETPLYSEIRRMTLMGR